MALSPYEKPVEYIHLKCKVCGKAKVHSLEMCQTHYGNWRKHGDPLYSAKLRKLNKRERAKHYNQDQCRVCGSPRDRNIAFALCYQCYRIKVNEARKRRKRNPKIIPEKKETISDPATIKEYARILGRAGGKKGGIARAKSLSVERRHEISSLAAQTRWNRLKQAKGELK